jgi:hypothetical protein
VKGSVEPGSQGEPDDTYGQGDDAEGDEGDSQSGVVRAGATNEKGGQAGCGEAD